MKVLAVLIYYKGIIDEVNANIRSFIDYVDKLIIWENSIIENRAIFLNSIDNKKVEFLGDGSNEGISKPLNIICSSIGREYDYLLTMDQDSRWINIHKYFDVIVHENRESIFAFGPTVIGSEKEINYFETKVMDTDHVIISGALIDIKYLKEIGGYNEDFWLDGIDEEVCFRAAIHHLTVKKISSAFLLQKYGDAHYIKLFGHSILIPEYSEKRKYEITKNHIIIMKKYDLPFTKRYNMTKYYIIKPFFDVLIFENNKVKKCISIIRGIIDGCKWKG